MNTNKIEIYQTEDGKIQLDVRLENETIWLTANQMALLFGRDEKTIRKHINNAITEELYDSVVVAKFATTTKHGALYGKKTIDDYTLVALTIMIAESRSEEKEMMISVIMNCIGK